MIESQASVNLFLKSFDKKIGLSDCLKPLVVPLFSKVSISFDIFLEKTLR